ncbi:MAG TPA: cytochrome c [Anaeromyxobacter sp.]|nr:cytochrome c [Anaeromyxobacter sp.]
MRRRLLLLALLAAAGCPRLDPMNTGENRRRAYQASEAFADGLAMRHPPAGTVPYRSAIDPVLATGLGADGRPIAASPVTATAATLARGRARFEIVCATCHGVLGDGESQVALNMALRKPPSLHAFRDVPDGHLYRVVSNGFGLMPSYANELGVEDRWAVVAYVRALQLSQHATLDQLPPEARQRLEKEAR